MKSRDDDQCRVVEFLGAIFQSCQFDVVGKPAWLVGWVPAFAKMGRRAAVKAGSADH